MFSAAQYSFMDGVDPASLRLGSIVVDLFSCGIPYADMVMEMNMREKVLSKGVHHSEDIRVFWVDDEAHIFQLEKDGSLTMEGKGGGGLWHA